MRRGIKGVVLKKIMLNTNSKFKFILFIICLGIAILLWLFYPKILNSRKINFSDENKIISLNDNGFVYKISTRANSVQDFLKEKNISLRPEDNIIPSKEEKIYPNFNIKIQRAVKIRIEADGKTIENYTLAQNVREAILENNLEIGRLDQISPDENIKPSENLVIKLTRINVEEKIISEDIDFKTTVKSDNKLGWREKKTEQAGEKGSREVKYKITYKNNKEISRVVLEKNITKEPVPEIVVQGTYMELGKANRGQGTWYAFKGGLFAASTSLPRGAYAKVTNLANNKTVVVQINDYGPQGKGRIIDLDKVAFAKIASIGAGVIGVKVEEVLN